MFFFYSYTMGYNILTRVQIFTKGILSKPFENNILDYSDRLQLID